MIADYSAEIKIANFQSVWKRQWTNEDRRHLSGNYPKKHDVIHTKK